MNTKEQTDILSEQNILKYLKRDCCITDISVMQEVTSTNTLLKQMADAGAKEGTVIIANSQTNGKGRIGRSFFSPHDTGVYMSVLLRPQDMPISHAVKITTMAAVAACEAIESVSDINPQIKWVNDIYVEGKKVSGILTEASFNKENGKPDYIVLGIGINVYPPHDGFPQDIENIAGCVFNDRLIDGKSRIAAEFLNYFMKYYLSGSTEYPKEYRRRCFVIGKDISVITPTSKTNAHAIDIDNECRLIVKYPDGRTEKLSSGEISVRLKNI